MSSGQTMLSRMRILWIFLFLLFSQLSFGNTSGLAGEALVDITDATNDVSGRAHMALIQPDLPEGLVEFLDAEETNEESSVQLFSATLATFLSLADQVIGQLPFLDRNHLLPRGKKYLLFQSLRLYC